MSDRVSEPSRGMADHIGAAPLKQKRAAQKPALVPPWPAGLIAGHNLL
jgi:hypothetical protein